MVRAGDFDRSVELPRGLTTTAIRKAIEYIESELADFVDLYYEQANIFSALVGIWATRALDRVSVYEKSRHADVAQQRFPDLKRRGSSSPPAPRDSLECKASKRPWAVQSHYDHPGWYIIWRYLVDPTCSLESRSRWSFGAWTWRSSRRATGSTRGARRAARAEAERTRSVSRIHLEN